jgi:RHS repeat-associated protein
MIEKGKVFLVCMGLMIGLFWNGSVLSFDKEISDFTTGDTSGEPQINIPPVVEVLPDVSSGKAPLTVTFLGKAWDEDGEVSILEWDFEGDGTFEVARSFAGLEGSLKEAAIKNELQKEYTFSRTGIFHTLLRVTDDKSESSVSSVTIQVFSDVPWLDIVPCSSTEFAYMARASYEVFFTSEIESGSIQFQVRDAWISYRLQDQNFGKMNEVKGVPAGNAIWYSNVFENIDVRYTVTADLLLEEFIVREPLPLSVLEQSFEIHGVDYKVHEDGSIGFYNGETLVFSIPRPVMYELNNLQKKCYGLHYEIVEGKEKGTYILQKVLDDQEWLKVAQYPLVIDSSTQGEIADPWEQQGLTPYGQYFKNFNEYVDPLTGHLTIRHTDYSLSGRGLDVAVTRVYTTAVAYKEEEDGSGEFVPVATYQEAPTDLGCGWSLDFPWLVIDEDSEPGKYLHLSGGGQVKTEFQDGIWVDEKHGFSMYENGDGTYTRYPKSGVREDYDSEGRLVSITDLNGNCITFSYSQYGLSTITDTVGRVLTFSYSGGKLTSISDGIRTTTYTYSGGKLVSVTDPIGRVTSYGYMPGNSFLITSVSYPTGGFSSYEYGVVIPPSAQEPPDQFHAAYPVQESDEGETESKLNTVSSGDTVSWESPRPINEITAAAGRPCILQRADGSLVMYFKDKYVWEEEVCYWEGKCPDCQYICETITHTEWWIKRSVSTDYHYWSAPENVVQVKSVTGNPVVIEKQDGSFLMFYKDKYVWTEENCYWEGCPWDCQYICETITHTEYWIYERTSEDGLIWGSPQQIQQTALGVRNIAAIQNQDSTFLLCYTDKIGSQYYIREMTSSDGLNWNTPSAVVQVTSGTGNPALFQKDSGTIYLAYRQGDSVYILTNTGSGWSSPAETTAVAEGDPAFLETESEVVLIYKGTNEHFYRISSFDGLTWSSPSQIAPNKALSDPATVTRKDRCYRVTAQYISASEAELVKVTEFSYDGDGYLPYSSDVVIRDSQTLKSSMHFEYDSCGRTIERISKDEQGVQTQKIVFAYDSNGQVIRQDVYAGTSQDISYSEIVGYDNWGNTVYTRGPEGAEHFYSYAHTDYENQFSDCKGVPVSLFSDQFYSNTLPSECHGVMVGEAFINNGKVQETYYSYDTCGNLIETKTLFPSRDYSIFSGTFDETGQTSFGFDLTGLAITDGILVISSSAVPTPETLHETHSEAGTGWQNSGSWSGTYFLADYFRCHPGTPPDCYDGQTEIGPFEHYPGSPDYTGYTMWIEDNTQYVQTDYSAVVNEYPETVEYRLNGDTWIQITDNLGSGTTSVTVPASSFVQGVNTLEFQESNTFPTKFEWTLYIDQDATPEEYVTSYTCDSYGNVTSIADALGNTTFFEYDSHHIYPASIISALNRTIIATYDLSTGLLTSVTDAKGNTTSFEYDILGRVTKRIHPDYSELEAVYDDQNNSVTIYDELDHYVIHYYDGIGRLTKAEWYIPPTSYLTETYTYNHLNELKSKTNPEGHTYTYEHDSQGRLTRVSNPDLTFKEIQYDNIANTTFILDENGRKKEYHYDWVDRLQWVKEYTDPVNYYLTQYMYDDAGNLTSLTDANGNTISYEYNSPFGVTQITYPDSIKEIFAYDAVGNLIQRTDCNGPTTFTYNSIYQLLEIGYPDQSISLEYDVNGNRTVMTDLEGQTSYTYDNRNRLLSETRSIEGIPYTVSYQYDAASRLIAMIYPDQTVVINEYDSLNRLVTISGYAEFMYNAESLLESVTYSNGIVATYQYDDRHRPISMHAQQNGSDLLIMNYQYDSVGNMTQLEYSRKSLNDEWVQSTEIFHYDWLDRLISAQGDYGSLSYSYDPLGNRLLQNDLMYTYNNMNELVSISDGSTFIYDESGNMSAKINDTDTWSYTYDTRNQLVQIEKNQQMVGQYEYNGDGRRIKKTEWVESLQEYQTTIYVYSGSNVIYEKNLNASQEATYVYGPTGRIAKNVNELTDYYHTDHLGSTRLITDENGNTVTDVSYTPFGEDSLNGEESYLYTGKERDSTGLYYYGARYYDPSTGRFLTGDIAAGNRNIPQTLNKYVYCLNNPLKYIDPSGNESEDPQYIVEQVFKKLQNIDPEQFAEIQEKIDSGEITELEAVAEIIDLLGYTIDWENSTDDYLSVVINSDLTINVVINNELKDEEGNTLWGQYDRKNHVLSINFSLSENVADIALTFCHEMSHAMLTGSGLSYKEEHEIIYGVEYSYMTAFRLLGVTFSDHFIGHLWGQMYAHDRAFAHTVPLPEVLRRYLPPTSPIPY